METRIVIWQCTAVACTLNVVLPTHRVDTRSLAPEITRHQSEIAETLDILNATDMFCDAKCVVDSTLIRVPVPHRGCLNILRWDPRNCFCPFRCPLADMFKEGIKPSRAIFDKIFVNQAFAGDNVCHTKQQCCVGTDAER